MRTLGGIAGYLENAFLDFFVGDRPVGIDEWFQKNRISTRDFELDTIYVNGSNNLPNLKKDEESWKVRLIEEEFHKRMWESGE